MIVNFIRIFLNFFDYFNQIKVINYFKKKINNPNVFFDVGAHHGETVKLFQKELNIKKFHCFEPSKINFYILKKKLKNFRNIKFNNFGLGEFEDKVNLNYTKETSSSTINEFNVTSKYLRKKLEILNINSLNDYITQEQIKVKSLDNYVSENKVEKIDILKIDTEGYELNVLKGCKENINKIRYIYFEHHFDDMIKKNYNLSNIHDFLIKNNFKKKLKVKMSFRKSFEYIYENMEIDYSIN